jgi:peptide/nickel transport system substrate-binding protein
VQFRKIRLRFHRRLRHGQKQVEGFGTQAEQQIERHIFKRFGRLSEVRRFVISWLLLVVLLIGGLVAQNIALSGYFQTVKPVPGGIYNEGVLGTFTNASPLYATSNADTTVSRLIFSGLLKYDVNNKLVGDLAKDITPDANGINYTVHLKPNLKWQDGQPLTSADVLFTYQTIQNPDAQSPLQNSWQGVVVSAPDPQTVTFKLSGPLAAFPYNLVNGIVPKHILGKIPVSDLRSADFNTVKPIGAGPFAWQAIEVKSADPKTAQTQIALVPFENYNLGQPKLSEFIVHIYADSSDLTNAFTSGKLTAIEGLSGVPKSVREKPRAQVHDLLLNAANMVFFKTTSGVLADQQVRQALVQSANVPKLIKQLDYATHMVREPFLSGQLGYDPAYAQSGFDLASAQKKLDAGGWIAGKNGIRMKGDQHLAFTLTAADNSEARLVTRHLKKQWRALGADVRIDLQQNTDFQTTLSYHSYDAVLYGISIGSDPDVFVYWDSSQADIRSANRLNLSEYKNTKADTALESGRTRRDPALRTFKYRPFLQEWQKDAPALALYQPRLPYVTNGMVAGLSEHNINSAVGRFNNVHNWEIRQAKVTN